MTIFRRSNAARIITGVFFYLIFWWGAPLVLGCFFIWTGDKPKLLSQEFWVCLGMIVAGVAGFLLIPVGIIAFIYQWVPVWKLAVALYFGNGFFPAYSYLLGETMPQPKAVR